MEGNQNQSNEDLRRVQLACLDMLKKFKRVCEENELRYFLAYGTLLGAERHKGYIPWDDDIDVWMPRPDMEKFLRIAESQMLPYTINYYTIHNDAFIKYRSQPCIEDHGFSVGINIGGQIQKGYIWIDIMPLDGMPSSKLARAVQCKLFSFWYIILGFSRSSITGAFNPDSKKGIKKIGIILNQKLNIGRLFDINKCLNSFERLRKRYSYDGSQFIVGTTTSYTDKAVFKKEWFEGERTLSFEGEEYAVPRKLELVLGKLYGNFRELPPVEKRQQSHFHVLDIEGYLNGK